MPPRVDPAAASSQLIGSALDDYMRSPGKHQVRLRQPAILFEGLRDVLQIAVGRDAGSGLNQGGLSSVLQEEARFFIRTALLYPDADHYAVLGLHQKANDTEVKERYRLMMRLLHPDFSDAHAGVWPPDAAVKVNRAYDVLSSSSQRRAFDERVSGNDAAAKVYEIPPRRPEVRSRGPGGEARRGRFRTLATVCAIAGAALAVLSVISIDTSDTGHLVQRSRERPVPDHSPFDRLLHLASPDPGTHARQTSTPQAPPARISASFRRSEPEAPRTAEVRVAPATVAVQPVVDRTVQPLQSQRISLAPPPVSTPETRTENLADIPLSVVQAPASAAQVVTAAAPLQVALSQRAAPKPGPTLIEAQPLLSQLLQMLESGRGDRILNLLDSEARNKPSAQALSRSYDLLVDGARPVRLSHVEFKAEPGDGKLLVVGQFRVVAGEQTIGSLGKKMVVRAEFVSRDGNVTISGLSGGPGN